MGIILIIAIIIIVGLIIWYLTSLDFEPGTGFTEMKKNAREGEFDIVDVDKTEKEVKSIEPPKTK